MSGEPGKAVQLSLMTVKQLAEGVAVAGDMGRQQLGVTAFPLAISAEIHAPDTHGRTVSNRLSCGTSPRRRPVRAVRTRPEP